MEPLIIDGKRISKEIKDELKEKILDQVNKSGVQTQRLIRSNKKLVFYYTYRKSGETFDITITPDELKK